MEESEQSPTQQRVSPSTYQLELTPEQGYKLKQVFYKPEVSQFDRIEGQPGEQPSPESKLKAQQSPHSSNGMHTLILSKKQVRCLKEVLGMMQREEGMAFDFVEEAEGEKKKQKKQVKYLFLRKNSEPRNKANTEKISPAKALFKGSPLKVGMTSHLASVYNSVQPSSGYIHEWQKHAYKSQHTSDLVKKYQQHEKFWKHDKFLQQNHSGVKNNQSKEGRKLGLAEFHKRFRERPLKKKSNERQGPYSKLPKYEVPTTKKRDDLRYTMRMKLHRSSAYQVNSSNQSASKLKTSSVTQDNQSYRTCKF